MKLLLPNYFKKIGKIIVPIGLLLWLAMQMLYIEKLLTKMGVDKGIKHSINVFVAIVGIMMFLIGLFFLAFSKEKIEDEMIQQQRMKSFQVASFSQIILIIIMLSWFAMSGFGNYEEEMLVYTFTLAFFVFWLTFIINFNYNIKYKINAK